MSETLARPRSVEPAHEPEVVRKHCERRLSAMSAERSSWWTHWIDLADHILPRRGRFLTTTGEKNTGNASSTNRGGKVNSKILDSTATLAHRTMAAGMMSGLTSPARPWFILSIEDSDAADNPVVKLWLALVTKRMLTVFAKSNIYAALHTTYEEMGCFGTAPLLIAEDRETIVRAYTMTAGEYLLASSARLDVDTLYRTFTMTVGQMVDQFGRDRVSTQVATAYDRGDLGIEHSVVHAVEPNPARSNGRPEWARGFARNMPYRSVYYEQGGPSDKLLALAGYHEQPFMAPRWHQTANDSYGRSPAMDALPDVRSLQLMRKRMAQGIDKMVNPPMVAPLAMQNQPMSVLPGGITFVNDPGRDVFRPAYQVNPQLGDLRAEVFATQQAIKEAFYADLFLLISSMEGQPRTAQEIISREGEKMLQLGPVVERSEGELLTPLIERTFGIMQRLGLFPPAPAAISGHNLDVSYISPLAQAQRAVSTTSIERMSAFVGNLSAVNPAVLQKIDMFEMLDEYADGLGVPPKIMVPSDKAKAALAAEKQQAQQAQMIEQASAGAAGAKTLSETDVGGGQNALALMLGR